MVGFDVTCDGAPGPALLATTIAGNRLLSMGTKGGCPRGAGFTRYLPGVRLMDAGTKNKGGAGRSLTAPGGLEDGEDYPCRRRQRYAARSGEGAREGRVRRELLRLPAACQLTSAGR